MKKILIILTVLLLSVGVTIGPFLLTQNAYAVDISHASWSSTSEFDNGQKVNIDTATNSCLALGNGFQLNATGGDYGVTLRCPTGAPAVSKVGLLFSTDMSTETPGYSLKDLSGSQRRMSEFGVVNVTGKFGTAKYFPTTTSLTGPGQVQFAPAWGFFYPEGVTISSFTVLTWIKLNMTGCSANVCTLFGDNSPGAVNVLWAYFAAPSAGVSALTFRYWNGTATRNLGIGSFPVDNTWHALAIRINYTGNKVQSFLDGIVVSSASMTNSVALSMRNYLFYVGNSATGAANDAFHSSIDDFLFFNRWVTNAEITAFSSVGSYATSGTWRSPKIFVNSTGSNGAEVETVILGYNNVSATAYISQIQILNGSDNSVIWTDLWSSPITSHTDNITYVDVPNEIIIPANGSAKVKIYLISNGVLTPTVNFVAVSFEEIESVTPSNIPNPTLDATAIMLILLIFAFVVLFVSGFFERFAMLGAGIDCAIISVLSWTWTGNIYVATMFIIMMALCVGFAITKREK